MAKRVNRRRFGAQLLAGATVPATASIAVSAAEPADKPPANPAADPSSLANLSRADLITECIKRQYADPRLGEEELTEIREAVERHFRQSELLRRYPLANSDQPATVLSPSRFDLPPRLEP